MERLRTVNVDEQPGSYLVFTVRGEGYFVHGTNRMAGSFLVDGLSCNPHWAQDRDVALITEIISVDERMGIQGTLTSPLAAIFEITGISIEDLDQLIHEHKRRPVPVA